jgi:hypothetical protein
MRKIKKTIEFVSKVIDEFENEIELEEVIISHFDVSGRIKEKRTFLDEDVQDIQSIVLYKYENDGRIIETMTLDRFEEPIYKINYLYNEKMLLEKKESVNLVKNVFDKNEVFKYNQNNHLIESYDISSNTKSTYEYSENGQINRILHYEGNSNSFTKVLIYTVNDNNDVDSILTLDHNEQPIFLETLVYEYDDVGNWIICHKSSDDNNIFIVKEITYVNDRFDWEKLGFKIAEINKLKVRDLVLHQSFGFGEILKIDGKKSEITALIKFDEYGEKKLYLKYATLAIKDNNNH